MSPATRRLRLLCVDNDRDSRDLIKLLFESKGHRVTLAERADSALALARSGNLDLVILDSRLADKSGVDLCKAIRDLDSEIRILFFSASAFPRDIAAAIDAGANAYLVKPEGFYEIERTVRDLTSGDTNDSPRRRRGRLVERADRT